MYDFPRVLIAIAGKTLNLHVAVYIRGTNAKYKQFSTRMARKICLGF